MFYVVLTGRMVRQMKETSDEESRPFVIPDIDFENHIGYFEVKNIGKLPARDLLVSITPDLIGIGGRNISQTLFSRPISFVPPSKVIKTVVDMGVEMSKDSYPKRYEITLEYKWGNKNTSTEKYVVDFSYRKGILYVNNKGLHDIAKSLEQLAKDFSSVVKWDGIYVKTTEDIVRSSRENEQFLKEAKKELDQIKIDHSTIQPEIQDENG